MCALSASRGHDGERAFHLLLDALNGAIAYANFAGDLDDAHAGPQTKLDADPRPSERFARLIRNGVFRSRRVTTEEKKAVGGNVYAHVWQQAMNKELAMAA